jgi:hypothetical protein
MGTLYIGLDVHKLSIAVSIAEEGRDGASATSGASIARAS